MGGSRRVLSLLGVPQAPSWVQALKRMPSLACERCRECSQRVRIQPGDRASSGWQVRVGSQGRGWPAAQPVGICRGGNRCTARQETRAGEDGERPSPITRTTLFPGCHSEHSQQGPGGLLRPTRLFTNKTKQNKNPWDCWHPRGPITDTPHSFLYEGVAWCTLLLVSSTAAAGFSGGARGGWGRYVKFPTCGALPSRTAYKHSQH